MKRFVLVMAVSAVALLADSQLASARGGRRGGHCGGCGGCCGTMKGGCGMSGGTCASGCTTCGGVALVQATGTEATLIVSLPEDATLTIDGEKTTSTSAQRVFVTPALEQGKEYEYTLKAKVERDGKVQVATAKVTIRPGQISQVELKVPAAGVAAQ
jgi:uncharacterized protein (TIGR03000 family)